MITMMVVVGDEPTDTALEIARKEVVLQQDAVLQGLVPTLDFALCLGMVWRSSHMIHALCFEPISQVGGDVDLDNFKTVNDCHGHAAGDHVLRSTCKNWQSQLRGRDLIGRLGGEEFCVLLPETRGSDALAVAERLRKTTEQQKLSFDGETITVSVSIGAAVYENIADTITSVIKRADQSLYKAKSSGWNIVETSVVDN